MKTCIVPNCNRKHSAKGYCKMHYTRLARHGDPLAVKVLAGEGYGHHGLSRSPEWVAWMGVRQRCYNPNNKDYLQYGGRGITMCERWQDSFKDFLADMGPKPSHSYSLDRKDGNGNYEPSNCRWADLRTQNLNRKTANRSKSGYRGVMYHKGKWVPMITVDDAQFGFGYYSDPVEAAYVRDQAAMQIYGSEAKLNFEYSGKEVSMPSNNRLVLADMGLQAYLDGTAHIHNGKDYAWFIDAMKRFEFGDAFKREIYEAMGITATTLDKYMLIYKIEKVQQK